VISRRRHISGASACDVSLRVSKQVTSTSPWCNSGGGVDGDITSTVRLSRLRVLTPRPVTDPCQTAPFLSTGFPSLHPVRGRIPRHQFVIIRSSRLTTVLRNTLRSYNGRVEYFPRRHEKIFVANSSAPAEALKLTGRWLLSRSINPSAREHSAESVPLPRHTGRHSVVTDE